MRYLSIITSVILALTLQSGVVSGQTYVANEGDILIVGTANARSWGLETRIINCKADMVFSGNTLRDISAIAFTVDVKDLKGHNIWMNRGVYKALKGYPFDKIYFHGVYFKTTKTGENDYLIKTEGNLVIAGVTQITSLSITLKVNPDGKIICTGSKAIKMSDFNVALPASEKKRMNIGDEVILSFAIEISKQN